MPVYDCAEKLKTTECSLSTGCNRVCWINLRGLITVGVVTIMLSACGGDGVDSGGSTTQSTPAIAVEPTTQEEASRFLVQAGFGANDSSISNVNNVSYTGWLDQQFAMRPRASHKAYIDLVAASLPSGQSPNGSHVLNTFWKQAAVGPDQLRQKVAFALSQICVISLRDGNLSNFPRGVASYLDMLGAHAFGNYRDILQAVSLHPMMGLYLSHLGNQKASGNRVPDQNFAREVMQLMSIGLYQLNPDGTLLIVNGAPVETYDNDDIIGMSHVFTGFSWAGPDKLDRRFFGVSSNPTRDPNRDVLPMQSYPQFHSTIEKRFLGVVIPAQSTADPDGSLRIALDTIFNHPNVGPFIGRQLIQRMVTSNPSPAYISRVTQAFNSGRYTRNTWATGTGRRGDMRATIAAVLLDDEARNPVRMVEPGFGKVREPVLRLAAWMRAFNATSASGSFLLGSTDDPARSLGQSPMRSPSVFNFYRPGYVPPNTGIAAANLVAPEFQIIHETSVVGYSNFMRSIVRSGVGSNSPRDIQPDYSKELALADDPDELIDRIDLLLTYNTMSTETRNLIRNAVDSISINPLSPTSGRQNRVYLATLLATSSPDFIVQK